MGELRQDQQALRDQLSKLLEEMRTKGMMPAPGQPGGPPPGGQPGGQPGNELGNAGEAMGEAQGRLGEGNADGAVDSQGRAAEDLEGMQS